jgi:hypothetical protein
MKPQINIDGVLRDMTDAEIIQYEIDKADHAARLANEQAKATAKAALLERLGITAEEAELLLTGNQ